MVAKAGGYYGEPFHGERGVTQGDPLSPTIFNVAVVAVVHHWEYQMVRGNRRDDSSGDEATQLARWTLRAHDGGKQRSEEGLKVQETNFYAEDRMVASTKMGWLQITFDMLTGIFDWVVLKTNFKKTVGVVCHPCQAGGVSAG